MQTKTLPANVQCKSCVYQMSLPDYDPQTNICIKCKNTRFVPNPELILCNMCGERARPIGSMNEQCEFGLENAKVSGGCDSTHLNDGTNYEFNLCEPCLRKMFRQFVIKPKMDYYMGSPDVYSFEQDDDEHEEHLWRCAGGHRKKYDQGLCNANRLCHGKALYSFKDKHEHFITDYCRCEAHKGDVVNYGMILVKFVSSKLRNFE